MEAERTKLIEGNNAKQKELLKNKSILEQEQSNLPEVVKELCNLQFQQRVQSILALPIMSLSAESRIALLDLITNALQSGNIDNIAAWAENRQSKLWASAARQNKVLVEMIRCIGEQQQISEHIIRLAQNKKENGLVNSSTIIEKIAE